MDEQLIDTSLGTMHLTQAGDGTPLLFVHGFPLDHRMWTEQIDEFSQTHRVLAPDLCGFGQSELPGEAAVNTMEAYADQLAELLDRLEIAEPVHLCGLSMGGYVAFQFWRRYHPRLKSLILCNTRALADSPEAKENREKTAKLVLEHGSEPLADVMSSKLLAPNTPEATLARLREMILAASPTGIAAASRGMRDRPDVTTWLPEIDLPTLVIAGDRDTLSPPEEMQQLAASIRGAEFHVIAGAGHLSPIEQPGEFSRLVRDFLHRQDASA